MQVVPVTSASPGTDPSGPVLMWLENGSGAIARGMVAVRLCFDGDRDRVAAAGRVLAMQTNGEKPVCELEWTHTGTAREQLGALIAARG